MFFFWDLHVLARKLETLFGHQRRNEGLPRVHCVVRVQQHGSFFVSPAGISRFRKSVKSRISEFACCHLLSHSVKDGDYVTYEKGRKCPSCFVLSIFKYKMGKINLLWAA